MGRLPQRIQRLQHGHDAISNYVMNQDQSEDKDRGGRRGTRKLSKDCGKSVQRSFAHPCFLDHAADNGDRSSNVVSAIHQ
jgi:hypothetical protein